MKTVLLFIIFSVLSFSGYGIVVGRVQIQGKVVNYDKKTVTLKNNEGKKIKVLRRDIPKKFKIRSGTQVYALISPKVLTRRISSVKKLKKGIIIKGSKSPNIRGR